MRRTTAVALIVITVLSGVAHARQGTAQPDPVTTADRALFWGLLGGGVAAMMASYNWQGGDPDRPKRPTARGG